MLFSQRKKIKPLKETLQINSLDDETRNKIWSAMYIYYWSVIYTKDGYKFLDKDLYREQTIYFERLWINYFKTPIDTLENNWDSVYEKIRKYCFECKWYELFDFIEFLVGNFYIVQSTNDFKKYINTIFEQEVVGYRLIKNYISEITSTEEISAVDEAINQPYKAVSIHLNRALELISDRKNPDYRNSIKESISAVESYCKIITNNSSATLGAAIKFIEKKSELHPALKSSISTLYGYTSDEKGIRHALLEDDKISFNEAKFMLVSCSAFINYLISKEV